MTTDNALVPVRMDMAEAERYGQVFAKGRAVGPSLIRDLPVDSVPARIAAVVMAGAELGFSPFTAIAGISIVEGKPRLGYQLLGALVRRSGRYDYRVVDLTNDGAAIEFRELVDLEAKKPEDRWRVLGVSTFTREDAEKAGLLGPTANGKLRDPWHKYPRNMLFARAMSNGINFYCPDVAAGCPVYSEDVEEEDVRTVQGRAVVAASIVAPEKTKLAATTLPETAKRAEIVASGPKDPDPALASAKAITDDAERKGAPPAEGVTETAKTEAVAVVTRIVRPDGSSVPLDSATAVIENARLEDEKKAAAKKGGRKKKDEPAKESPAPAQEAPKTETKPVEEPAKTEPPKTDPPKTETPPAKPSLAPEKPAATETDPKAHPDVPTAGGKAFALALEIGKLPKDAPVDMKLAAKAHVIGVNWYGSDPLARSAWVSVGYTLPKKGDKVNAAPTAAQVDAYLAAIVEKAEEKERADEHALFGANTSPDF